MSVRSGQGITIDFTTASPTTLAAADADSLPTGKVIVNGTDDAATVTVTNKTTGEYKAAATLPTLAIGDVVEMRINATVGGIAGKAIVWRDACDILLSAAGKTSEADKTGYALSVTPPTAAANASATAAQITTDHGAGSYIRNTEPLDAAGTRTALGSSGDIDARFDSTFTAADNAATSSANADAKIGTPIVTVSADIAAVKGDTASSLARLGAWTGSAANTVLGAFRAIWNKQSGLTPSDLTSGVTLAGDRGDNTTDSLPAIRDRGDAAWTTGSGGSTTITPDDIDAIGDEVVGRIQDIDVTLVTAFRGGTMTIYQGAEYSPANGNSVNFPFTNLPDLTGGTAKFTVKAPDGTQWLEHDLTINDAGTPTQTIVWAIPASVSQLIHPPQAADGKILYKAAAASNYMPAIEFPVQTRRL